MANEKILNTRIQLKYDSYEKWNSSSVVLKAGEIAIAHLGPANKDGSTHASGQHPVLIKVGDNTHTFAQLPWLSALAADVYAWAKKENPDWNDFPALPIEVIDNGTGKFVTDIEYADNKITISRSDVDWNDVKNAPDFALKSELPTDFGVLTVEAADASLEIAPTAGDVKAKAKLSAAEGNILRLESDGLYVPAPAEVTLPSYEDSAAALSFVTEVDQTNGEIVTSKAALVQGANITLTQDAAGGNITIAGKDWSGEIAAVDTGVMSVSGKDAIVATGDDAVEVSLALDNSGNVVLSQSATGLKATIDLSEYRKIADDEDTKYGLSYDSNAKQIKLIPNGGDSYIDASDFVVDGMLESVVADQTANTLTFTWNTDGKKTVTTVNLSDIADIYTGVDGTTIKVDVSSDNKVSAEVKTGSLKDGHIASDAAIAETKLAQGVQDALALARTAIQEHQSLDNYKTKQTAVADKISESDGYVLSALSQNENGEISYSTVKFDPSVFGAKTLQEAPVFTSGSTVKTVTAINQNLNGDITVTYEDIAFPEPPVVNNGKLTVSGTGALTGSGEFTANQDNDTSIAIDVADKGITTAKIADHAVGAHQTKACQDYTGDDAEVWVFYCGTSDTLV